VAHAKVAEVVLDGLLAVAAVGGDRAGWAPGACANPIHSWCQLGCVGRVAAFDVVVHDHTVVAFDELGLVAELDRLTEPSLGDGPGIGIVQADPPGRSVRCLPREPLSGLRGDLPGGGGQVLEVVDGAGQASAPAA
jgi:hypothetical protein